MIHKTKNSENQTLIKKDCLLFPKEYLDPVSLEPLTDPYISKCGHIFNMKTMEKILSVREKYLGYSLRWIECPLCKSEIYIFSEVYPNRILKDIVAKALK